MWAGQRPSEMAGKGSRAPGMAGQQPQCFLWFGGGSPGTDPIIMMVPVCLYLFAIAVLCLAVRAEQPTSGEDMATTTEYTLGINLHNLWCTVPISLLFVYILLSHARPVIGKSLIFKYLHSLSPTLYETCYLTPSMDYLKRWTNFSSNSIQIRRYLSLQYLFQLFEKLLHCKWHSEFQWHNHCCNRLIFCIQTKNRHVVVSLDSKGIW